MNITILTIKIINWLLILTALMYTLFWYIYPDFMMLEGGSFIIIGLFNTFLLIKLLSFSKQEWSSNFVHVRKRLPWLLYILVMGFIVHHYLETVYWAPKRIKTIQGFEEKYERTRMIEEKSNEEK